MSEKVILIHDSDSEEEERSRAVDEIFNEPMLDLSGINEGVSGANTITLTENSPAEVIEISSESDDDTNLDDSDFDNSEFGDSNFDDSDSDGSDSDGNGWCPSDSDSGSYDSDLGVKVKTMTCEAFLVIMKKYIERKKREEAAKAAKVSSDSSMEGVQVVPSFNNDTPEVDNQSNIGANLESPPCNDTYEVDNQSNMEGILEIPPCNNDTHEVGNESNMGGNVEISSINNDIYEISSESDVEMSHLEAEMEAHMPPWHNSTIEISSESDNEEEYVEMNLWRNYTVEFSGWRIVGVASESNMEGISTSEDHKYEPSSKPYDFDKLNLLKVDLEEYLD